MEIEERTVFYVGDKEFRCKDEANRYIESQKKKNGYLKILQSYANDLCDGDKKENYCTEKENFEGFIDGLADFLAEKY